ncbi:Alpha/beta hydrolase family-domain-containing protein [Hygrophoropsis aurantiaca]|uniref:Alpha/beta hydrolase family-domain-containing protein n=1 Tax=Hygrophoropsis aurantiaca TaxID=72124 RepID=A0ACB8A617_9AGAM|nr:Alpha/beta hydrolase family-domain-containing protein [Hygrophoropsis aurantiaca]
MSSLYRSAISARIAKLPGLPPTNEDEDDEVPPLPTGMGPPPFAHTKPHTPKPPNPTYAPISAQSFFAQALSLHVPPRGLNYRAYYTPPRPSIREADGKDVDPIAEREADAGTVLVFHHGAGYGALSFACVAKEVHDLEPGLGVFAFDARGHGKTVPLGDSADDSVHVTNRSSSSSSPPTTLLSSTNETNLSTATLVDDLIELLRTAFPEPKRAPTFILIGHSMGGSVIVRACPHLQNAGYTLAGVVVLDVVEGSAIDALPHMHALLNTRPDGFDSIEEAVEWHVTTRLIHNPASARVSIPSVIVPSDSPLLRGGSQYPATPTASRFPYTWRTPLRRTAPYWSDWFTNLSSLFLAARTARLLVLAGAERLDTPLMVGQMQGKFQVEVVRDVGHVLHEDDPQALAQIFVAFWRRNERARVGIGAGVRIRRVGE